LLLNQLLQYFLQFEQQDRDALAALEKESAVVDRNQEMQGQLDKMNVDLRQYDEDIAAQDEEIKVLQQKVTKKKFQKEAASKKKAEGGGCSVQ
jgi:hypothetical protein